MSISYNTGIPAGPHNPSADQPLMLVNTNAINQYVAVDHVAFNVSGSAVSGQHKQVTFNAPLGSDPNLATPIGSLYTKASLTTSTSDLYWQNGALAANVARLTGGGITAACWCQFNGTSASPITPNESYNMGSGASITNPSTGNYTLTFARNFATTNYAIQVTPSIAGNGASITITARAAGSVSFAVRSGGSLVNSSDISVVIFGTLT
ncbi:MAG TPA: hypothetical protein DCP92_24690 [Nitrospiraceae bacterium]|jgi:hypothetical protein|nr:hypothetical protein [Nitrospiraceae bacterium]